MSLSLSLNFLILLLAAPEAYLLYVFPKLCPVKLLVLMRFQPLKILPSLYDGRLFSRYSSSSSIALVSNLSINLILYYFTFSISWISYTIILVASTGLFTCSEPAILSQSSLSFILESEFYILVERIYVSSRQLLNKN